MSLMAAGSSKIFSLKIFNYITPVFSVKLILFVKVAIGYGLFGQNPYNSTMRRYGRTLIYQQIAPVPKVFLGDFSFWRL